jgi:hypothetical protein
MVLSHARPCATVATVRPGTYGRGAYSSSSACETAQLPGADVGWVSHWLGFGRWVWYGMDATSWCVWGCMAGWFRHARFLQVDLLL